jgi:hypothetical protein
LLFIMISLTPSKTILLVLVVLKLISFWSDLDVAARWPS